MKIRSFLAFDIPKEVREQLEKLINMLSSKTKGVKWVDPKNIHCTLSFFGSVEEELLLGKISDIISNETKESKPAHLNGIGIGVFPNWRYPRVIWAGLTGDTELITGLHNKLERSFEKLGFKPDERAFRLHLTLGRTKSSLKNSKQLISDIEKMVALEFGNFTVDHLTLYSSVLTKKGPIYTPLREFPFKKT